MIRYFSSDWLQTVINCHVRWIIHAIITDNVEFRNDLSSQGSCCAHFFSPANLKRKIYLSYLIYLLLISCFAFIHCQFYYFSSDKYKNKSFINHVLFGHFASFSCIWTFTSVWFVHTFCSDTPSKLVSACDKGFAALVYFLSRYLEHILACLGNDYYYWIC